MKKTPPLRRLICLLCIVTLLTLLTAVPMQAEGSAGDGIADNDICSIAGNSAALPVPFKQPSHQDHHRHCVFCCKHTLAISSPSRIDYEHAPLVYRFPLAPAKTQLLLVRAAWLSIPSRGPPLLSS